MFLDHVWEQDDEFVATNVETFPMDEAVRLNRPHNDRKAVAVYQRLSVAVERILEVVDVEVRECEIDSTEFALVSPISERRVKAGGRCEDAELVVVLSQGRVKHLNVTEAE